MAIEQKDRGGERNFYERKAYQASKVTDVSDILGHTFLDKLEAVLSEEGEEVGVQFEESTVAVFTHNDGAKAAYLTGFYPLDIEFSSYETEAFIRAVCHADANYLPTVVQEIIDEHIYNIVDEVKRVKSYHPGSKLTVIFAPADTITSSVAKPIYGFCLNVDKKLIFESESSFIVLPEDELSRAYMAETK